MALPAITPYQTSVLAATVDWESEFAKTSSFPPWFGPGRETTCARPCGTSPSL